MAAALIVVDCIPTEVWTDVVLQFLATPDDLAMLAIALGPAETVAAMAAAAAARAVADAAKAAASAAKVHADKLAAIPSLALAAKLSAGARFVGVMSDAELAWFAAHGIAVALLVECHTVHHPQIIPGCIYLGPEQYSGLHWTQNGVLHRDGDLPAIESFDGARHWFFRGKKHRENGLPAVEYANGNREWWEHGNLHRDGGLPARDSSTSGLFSEWYVRGKRHRDGDLPAVVYANGYRGWWVHGDGVSTNTFSGDYPGVSFTTEIFLCGGGGGASGSNTSSAASNSAGGAGGSGGGGHGANWTNNTVAAATQYTWASGYGSGGGGGQESTVRGGYEGGSGSNGAIFISFEAA